MSFAEDHLDRVPTFRAHDGSPTVLSETIDRETVADRLADLVLKYRIKYLHIEAERHQGKEDKYTIELGVRCTDDRESATAKFSIYAHADNLEGRLTEIFESAAHFSAQRRDHE